jgi:Peptidase family C25/Propeptide_C25/FlgD Ig-like domain
MKSKISTIILFLVCLPAFAQDELKVISSDRNSIIIEYTPRIDDTSFIRINNQSFLKIDLSEGFYGYESSGLPAIPQRSINIGVPAEFGNTIKVLNYTYKELNAKLAPIPRAIKDSVLNSNVYEINNSYYNYEDKNELVSFGNFGIARGIPIQAVVISPVSFSGSQNSIKVFTKIRFQIHYSSNQKIASSPADDFLSGAILNYNVARYWVKGINQNKLRKVAAVNSVLASGKWIKFETPTEGIYKITRTMLSSYGINADNVDPRTIRIYNNGGKMLPENTTLPYPSDLVENAILVKGEEDGKFDDGDYILFYGRGTDFWDYDSTQKAVKRFNNLYSKQNYYFITSGGSAGKRIQNESSLNQADVYKQNSTAAFLDWDVDKINIGGTGRYFLGDNFSELTTSITYTHTLDGRIANSPINYSFRIVNTLKGSISVQVYENSTRIFSQSLQGISVFGISDDADYTVGIESDKSAVFTGDLPDNRSLLKFQITGQEPGTSAYLDFFEISYQKQLKAVNDSLTFFSKDTSSAVEYDLLGFSNSNIQVFNVSDFANVKVISNPVLLSGGDFSFQARENSGNISKYIAVGNDKFKSPSDPVEITNQNIRGTTEGVQYIIITDKTFNDQANRLKNYRESQAKNKLSTLVFDVDEIYNEFSGGLLDPSGIRNFIKYVYGNWTIKPEYVLLFGDGTYDYKNIEGKNNNFIPTYQAYAYNLPSYYKYDEIYSYPMDDYYVSVDGENGDKVVDLAIGRLPVQSVSDAENVVDKIINYETNTDKDLWRNLVTLVADDGLTSTGDDGVTHTNQSEILANSYIPPSFDLNKIYLAAYPTVIAGIGRTKPGVNEAIIEAINSGTLILNYVGHGAYNLWAHERVFENSSTIPRLHNSRYFFLTAATCDFSHYDQTSYQSGAEEMILKENSGSIGAFSAARPVESGANAVLNELFYTYLLKSRDSSGLPITIGKAYYYAKLVRTSPNDQKFGLFGDPALRLLIPEYNANIDSINGQNLQNLQKVAASDSSAIQIKALSKAQIDGVIKKPDNSIWNDFSGEGIITVYDSQRKYVLTQLSNYPMTLQGGIIFRGRVSITNGKFSSDFTVPKDISYQNENGKVIVYFFNDQVDGLGYTDNIIVGGTDSTTVNDGKGPDVEIYFDDTSFKNSYLVNPNSKLIVKLTDETGINAAGTGVGHKLEGILNDNINDPIDFTNYFASDLNSAGKSGQINYAFNDIAQGEYKIDVKAWDVFNNYSSATAYFTVVNGDNLEVRDVYNYPNPFAWNTTFTFQQNLNSVLDLKIKIYTIAGRLIKEIEKNNIIDKYVTVPWDGRDEDGNVIANGTYFYKLIVKTTDGKYSSNVLGKLAVIR